MNIQNSCYFKYQGLNSHDHFILSKIFYHLYHYIKSYQRLNPHFEKPAYVFFQLYRRLPLLLHLSQWQLTNQAASLIQLRFAQIKRNPE